LQAMRLHQWLKNTLLFLPLVLSHQLNDITLIAYSLLGFLSFGLCASSVYLINDMLDLDADRQHSSKHCRPFASGKLPLAYGFIAGPLLAAIAFSLAALLPVQFLIVLASYFLLTMVYNFFFKAIVLVDVLTLATLYTLRIIAGAAAVLVVPTFWLLAFSMFLFLSLAIVKRFTELEKLQSSARQHAAGRGYLAVDLTTLAMMGSSSGFMAVLVFALYINDEETRNLYATPELLWLLCPLLLYLVSRIWLIAQRGLLHEDPIVFALTDHRSQLIVLLCGLLVWAATGSWF
jgi:4-hydroxybenzoate polyprenyltransferase